MGIGTLTPSADVSACFVNGERSTIDLVERFARVTKCRYEIPSGRMVLLPSAAPKDEGCIRELEPGPYRLYIPCFWREGIAFDVE